uniref:Protein TIFY n=1 Tax=Euphorbia lathyris TaxID=212925 RepID=A0A2L0W141_EUPLT|nr:jasmonate ZIM domain-containing protein 8 [Euphorbia lathyris]
MTRNNSILELNLFPTSHSDLCHPPVEQDQTVQQITIFYNGNVCVSDVTELQAKAILLLATREKEANRSTSPTGSSSSSEQSESTLKPSSLSSPICNPNGLSMKKSLQRFLQKRNHRMQSTFPYHINHSLKSCTLRRH